MGSTFIPSRCAIVDEVCSNVLIRGNMPLLENGQYAYHEIQEALGRDLSAMRWIEIPIIDNVGERAEFSAIMQAFGVDSGQFPEGFWPWWQQPEYDPNQQHGTELRTEGVERPGAVIWRPFEGLPPDTDPAVFLGSPGWDYRGFINQVYYLTKRCVDTAIYVHCQLGADRTGAFHIGYLMEAHGISLAKASEIANNATSAGPPNADYQRLVEAY